jgi:hypothetical protein
MLTSGCHSWLHTSQPCYIGSTADTKLERWLDNHPKVTSSLIITGVAVGATAGLITLGALYLAANSDPTNSDTPTVTKKK